MRTINTDADSQAPRKERRHRSRDAVTRMIQERTQVLALYWRLAGLDPLADANQRARAQRMLMEFGQLLVDYIAAGHFSLYERIANGTERRRGLAALAQELYPRIAETTEVALDFNDKYDGDACEITESLKADLSRLGEELAARIELEDRLIARLVS